MEGEGPVSKSMGKKILSVAQVAELAALIRSPLDREPWSRGADLEASESETQRVGSSYSLGAAIRQDGEAGELALGTLIDRMVAGKESVRRAATWGIGLGGSKAVGPLLRLIADPTSCETAFRADWEARVGAVPDECSQLTGVEQQAVITNSAYALRVAVDDLDDAPLAVVLVIEE